MAKVVIFLPHYDDEFFLGRLLVDICRQNEKVVLAYLTCERPLQRLRLPETQAYLKALGIDNVEIRDIGRSANIFDGDLYTKSISLFKELQSFLIGLDPKVFICPAWEGGHHDHDATSLFVKLLTQLYCPQVEVLEFGLYGALFGPFFRLNCFVRSGEKIQVREDQSWWLNLKQAFLMTCFPSQFRAFLGLGPLFLVNRLMGATIGLRPVPADRDYTKRPHSGPLLYEKRYGVSWDDFLNANRSLIEQSIGVTK